MKGGSKPWALPTVEKKGINTLKEMRKEQLISLWGKQENSYLNAWYLGEIFFFFLGCSLCDVNRCPSLI